MREYIYPIIDMREYIYPIIEVSIVIFLGPPIFILWFKYIDKCLEWLDWLE